MTKINEKIEDLQNKLIDLPNNIIQAREDMINKMLLAEESLAEFATDLTDDIAASNKNLYETCEELGSQRCILNGASNISHYESFSLTNDYTDLVGNTLKTPIIAGDDYDIAYELADAKTFSGTPGHDDYFDNFFLTRHKANEILVTQDDVDSTISPILIENNLEEMAALLQESSGTRALLSYDAIYYTGTDTTIAQIKADGTVIANVSRYGIITNVPNTESITLNEDLSEFIIGTKTLILVYTSIGISSDVAITMAFTEDQSDYDSLATEELTWNSATKAFELDPLANPATLSSMQIWQNGTQIGSVTDTGDFMSIYLDVANCSYNSVTDKLTLKFMRGSYSETDTIEVKYATLVTAPADLGVGKVNATVFSLTDLTGSSTYDFEDESQVARTVAKDTIEIIFDDGENSYIAATADSAGVISGTYDGVTIAGTASDTAITALTFTTYPTEDWTIRVNYGYLQDLSTFDATYDELSFILLSDSVHAPSSETIKLIRVDITGALITTLNQLRDILYVRKKTDYSIWGELTVTCHGLQVKSGWDYITDDTGQDSTTITHDQMTTLMGWMDPTGIDDIIVSADTDNASSSIEYPKGSGSYPNVENRPFWPATNGEHENDNNEYLKTLNDTLFADHREIQEKSWGGTIYDTLIWYVLNHKKWTYDMSPRYENSIFSFSGSPDKKTDDPEKNAWLGTFLPEFYTTKEWTSANIEYFPDIDAIWSGYIVKEIDYFFIGTEPSTIHVRMRMNGTTHRIEYDLSNYVPSVGHNWIGSWTSEATCWWNDFLDELYYLGGNSKTTSTPYGHTEQQHNLLVTLQTIPEDPNTNGTEDTAFDSAISAFTSSALISTVNSNYTTMISSWAGNDIIGASSNGFDVTSSSNGNAPIKTNLVAGSSDMDTYYTACDTRLDQINFRIGSVRGICTTDTTNKLIDSDADFVTDGVAIDNVVLNDTDSTIGYVKNVDDLNTLSIKDIDGNDVDLCPDGNEVYTIELSTGYTVSLFNAINPMIGQDIKYVTDPLNDYSAIETLYEQYVSNKAKLDFYDGP